MNPTQFMSKNLNFNLEFQNFIIPGIFQELSGTLELLWKWTNFWQVWRIGYFFHSVFSLELDFQGGIQKFHHSWNLFKDIPGLQIIPDNSWKMPEMMEVLNSILKIKF